MLQKASTALQLRALDHPPDGSLPSAAEEGLDSHQAKARDTLERTFPGLWVPKDPTLFTVATLRVGEKAHLEAADLLAQILGVGAQRLIERLLRCRFLLRSRQLLLVLAQRLL